MRSRLARRVHEARQDYTSVQAHRHWQIGQVEPPRLLDLARVDGQRPAGRIRLEADDGRPLAVSARLHGPERAPLREVQAELLARFPRCRVARVLPALDPAARQLPLAPVAVGMAD